MIAVLDYGIGNLASAARALRHIGGQACLVSTPDAAARAEGVVLPGVGAFGACVAALRASGLDRVVFDALERAVPLLGICVGMQMLYEGSDEDPGTPGLGILAGRVRLLSGAVKRPQMQWNVLERVPGRDSALLAGGAERPWVYFVHSFAPEPTSEVVATCDYGGPVVAAVERGPLWATQFHPEKSGQVGLGMLGNFVRACAGAPARAW